MQRTRETTSEPTPRPRMGEELSALVLDYRAVEDCIALTVRWGLGRLVELRGREVADSVTNDANGIGGDLLGVTSSVGRNQGKEQ
jgi:hypothetical protein